jgi:DNA repair protein RecO (recombination protein O)
MALVRSRCLILQSYPYSETSRILRLLTEDFGVQSVIAKGARRPKSRFGGLLEPFTEGTASFYHRETRDLHTLGGFDLDRTHRGVGSDLLRFAGASLVAELVLHTATAEPHPELFERVSAALRVIDAAEEGQVAGVVLAAAWSTLALLGFGAETAHCVRCGVEIDPAVEVRFDAPGGGVSCAPCRKVGRPVPAAARAELAGYVAGADRGGPSAHAHLHVAMLEAFLAAQLERGRPFRSLDLVASSLPDPL